MGVDQSAGRESALSRPPEPYSPLPAHYPVKRTRKAAPTDKGALGPTEAGMLTMALGVLAGLHGATYSAYKDSPHESFLLRRFIREMIIALSVALVLILRRPSSSSRRMLARSFQRSLTIQELRSSNLRPRLPQTSLASTITFVMACPPSD